MLLSLFQELYFFKNNFKGFEKTADRKLCGIAKSE